MGFGETAAIAARRMDKDLEHLRALRDRFWSGINDVPGLVINGSLEHGFPGILNVSAEGVEGESLLLAVAGVSFGILAGLWLGYVLVGALNAAGFALPYYFPWGGLLAIAAVGIYAMLDGLRLFQPNADAEGREISTTDRDGRMTCHAYDASGRQIRVGYPVGEGLRTTQQVADKGFDGVGFVEGHATTPCDKSRSCRIATLRNRVTTSFALCSMLINLASNAAWSS